jgi:hypothetical protein
VTADKHEMHADMFISLSVFIRVPLWFVTFALMRRVYDDHARLGHFFHRVAHAFASRAR